MKFHLAAAMLTGVSMAQEFTKSPELPRVASAAVSEGSGLAVSAADPDFLWAINDSGGTPEIHLIGTDGADHGKVRLTGAPNTDWEDLAAFTLDGKNYLLVADTGDNNAVRKSTTLQILREPALPAAGKPLAATVLSEWKIEFTYDGGPRDCESVAVDAAAGKIILVSKRTKPPEIYELPLRPPASKKPVVAVKTGTVLTDSPLGNLIPFASQPVGMDISADHSFAAILTYYGVFVFPRVANDSWPQTLAKKPLVLAPHGLPQAESVAISKDGKSIFVLSEGKHQPVVRYQIAPAG